MNSSQSRQTWEWVTTALNGAEYRLKSLLWDFPVLARPCIVRGLRLKIDPSTFTARYLVESRQLGGGSQHIL